MHLCENEEDNLPFPPPPLRCTPHIPPPYKCLIIPNTYNFPLSLTFLSGAKQSSNNMLSRYESIFWELLPALNDTRQARTVSLLDGYIDSRECLSSSSWASQKGFRLLSWTSLENLNFKLYENISICYVTTLVSSRAYFGNAIQYA